MVFLVNIADMSHDKDVIGEKIVECVQRMEKNELSSLTKTPPLASVTKKISK